MSDNLVYRVECSCGVVWYAEPDLLKRGAARCPRVGCPATKVEADPDRDACTVRPCASG